MRYSVDQINGSEFDPDSIMLYFFPAYLTKDGKGTHANNRLSPTDVKWVEKEYPGGEMSPSEFYRKVYGVSINNPANGGITFSGFPLIGGLIPQDGTPASYVPIALLSVMLGTILILVVYILFFKKKNRKK